MSEWNLHDPTDIKGINRIIRTDDIDSEANLEIIEKNIVQGMFLDTDKENVPASQKLIFDLDNIIKHNVYDNTVPAQSVGRSATSFHNERQSNRGASIRDDEYSRYSSPRRNNPRESPEPHRRPDPFGRSGRSEQSRESEPFRESEQPRSDNYRLSQYRTNEQIRAETLKQFFRGDNDDADETNNYSIEPGRLEDDKVVMLQQIENLKVELDLEGCDTSKFEVSENDSYDKIQDICRKLKLKSQYKTYSNMFDESILLGAEFVEWAFDGDKEYMGYKPDMIGWSDTVKLKLKRMRLETASFVSGVMQEYKMSAGLSIMTQLVVSGILYSVTKRKNDEEYEDSDRHTTDKEFREAMTDF